MNLKQQITNTRIGQIFLDTYRRIFGVPNWNSYEIGIVHFSVDGRTKASDLIALRREISKKFEIADIVLLRTEDSTESEHNSEVREYVFHPDVSTSEAMNFAISRVTTRFILLSHAHTLPSADEAIRLISAVTSQRQPIEFDDRCSESSDNFHGAIDIQNTIPYYGFFDLNTADVYREYQERVTFFSRRKQNAIEHPNASEAYRKRINSDANLLSHFPAGRTQLKSHQPKSIATDHDDSQAKDALDVLPGLAFPRQFIHEPPEDRKVRVVCGRANQLTAYPLVSVIVPVYNGEATIESSLLSLLDQYYSNLEIIVIDDCSQDNTVSIVESLGKRDPRLYLIKQQVNRGTYWARNVGISQAKGSYLTFQDADDISLKSRILQSVLALERNRQAQATMSYYLRMNGQGDPVVWSGHIVRRAYISLMFRSDYFRERLGSFDCVRGGADAELFERFCIGGSTLLDVRRDVQYLALQSEESLSINPTTGSTANHLPGSFAFTKPRAKYRIAYRRWHKKIAQGKSNTRLPFPPTTRPFRAPLELSCIEPTQQK